MKTILILGAGRSSSSLISYILEHAAANEWTVIVGDLSVEAARERIGSNSGQAVDFDIKDEASSAQKIAESDVVISLLPADFHPLVAKLCLSLKKHFLSASYVSEDMNRLHKEASKNGLLFLNECGLDPGIDHMSAVQIINRIKAMGGILTSFESFTGGLITADTDPENPWRYKFTWNPRNVVMAGQGTAKFLSDGEYKYVPYQQLFKRTTPVEVSGTLYEGYPNRDSLKYLDSYGLQGIRTMIRGTLRNAGFCSAWNILVQLGCCDDSYIMENVAGMTHRDFIKSFLAGGQTDPVEEKISSAFGFVPSLEDIQRLRWSGLFSDTKVGLATGSPAQILEHILKKQWKLMPGDKDLIVMWHRLGYTLNGSVKSLVSHLTVPGQDETQTAMAKTVGLPLGIAAKLLLQGKIPMRGVAIPIHEEIYAPVLSELKKLGIVFVERESELHNV
jgi:saccharopine dehydrogenase-like NADP-dependent oxidoreductase